MFRYRAAPEQGRPWTLFLPAMLVAVREGRRLTAIQRIFLDAQTASYRMKLMLGRRARGAWQGEGGGQGTLAIAEGFETARAFTILNDIPCWATLGARRFDQIQRSSSIERLILAIGNDAAGRRGATKAEERYARPGLSIERMPPKESLKDWAKVLETGERRNLKPTL
ncbi:toprim domain-containing protein [Sphingopyxis bauzanensis]|nr:toprim domain-containing protein [Sphingopyxis bauzanensis]